MLRRYSRIVLLCGLTTFTCGSGGGPFMSMDGCASNSSRHNPPPACSEDETYRHDGAAWVCTPRDPCATDQDLILITPESCDPCVLSLPASRALNGCKELDGVDLEGWFAASGYLRGVDLSEADLSGANMTHADLADADLSGANLEGAVMARTRLNRANLEDAVLADADLSDARLNGANLSGVVWVNTRCPDGTVSDHHGDTCCEHLDGAVPSAGCDPMASE